MASIIIPTPKLTNIPCWASLLAPITVPVRVVILNGTYSYAITQFMHLVTWFLSVSVFTDVLVLYS